ncbi:MAG TPA: diphthamide biosynthesis enzyme Dph2 [Nitrososphaeria archaeon]|nr:diphthamide biosynthesis enzyme Dph2 [Nitrososphaeria archaeon]
MIVSGYRVDVEEASRWIRANGIRRALLQAPPGLREPAIRLAEELSGHLECVFFDCGGCWGGCDLAVHRAKAVGADGIIHLGHAPFLERAPIPTLYLECRRADPRPLLEMLDSLEEGIRDLGSLGLGMTVQWLDYVEAVREKLARHGLKIRVGDPSPPLRYAGQVLGCCYNPLLRLSDAVNGYLIVGSRFHGLGLALQTHKPVYSLDPELRRIYDSSSEAGRLLKSRYAYIERFRAAGRIGVILSVKPGQYRLGLARRLVSLLRSRGKHAEVLVMDDVSLDRLRDSGFRGFVNTACPRLSIEDQMGFEDPILLPAEALVAIGEMRWKEVVRTSRYFSMEA